MESEEEEIQEDKNFFVCDSFENNDENNCKNPPSESADNNHTKAVGGAQTTTEVAAAQALFRSVSSKSSSKNSVGGGGNFQTDFARHVGGGGSSFCGSIPEHSSERFFSSERTIKKCEEPYLCDDLDGSPAEGVSERTISYSGGGHNALLKPFRKKSYGDTRGGGHHGRGPISQKENCQFRTECATKSTATIIFDDLGGGGRDNAEEEKNHNFFEKNHDPPSPDHVITGNCEKTPILIRTNATTNSSAAPVQAGGAPRNPSDPPGPKVLMEEPSRAPTVVSPFAIGEFSIEEQGIMEAMKRARAQKRREQHFFQSSIIVKDQCHQKMSGARPNRSNMRKEKNGIIKAPATNDSTKEEMERRPIDVEEKKESRAYHEPRAYEEDQGGAPGSPGGEPRVGSPGVSSGGSPTHRIFSENAPLEKVQTHEAEADAQKEDDENESDDSDADAEGTTFAEVLLLILRIKTSLKFNL